MKRKPMIGAEAGGPCSILVDTGRRETDSFTGKTYRIEQSCGKPSKMVKTGRGHWFDCGKH